MIGKTDNNNSQEEKHIQNIHFQQMYDCHNFTEWCFHLFELNERLFIEISLTNKLKQVSDGYLLRSYFIALWELIYNGKAYLERQEEEEHLVLIKSLFIEVLNECSDDDYFMLQYYRNCASHIFLSRYSPLTEKGNAKLQDSEVRFYNKKGRDYKLTYSQMLDKVERVYGGKYGTILELKYKRKIIERFYPFIHNTYIEIKKMDREDTNMLVETIGIEI